MTLDSINETRTLLLLIPYVLLYVYYIKYIKDSFFIKSRGDVQLLFMIYTAVLIFIEIFAWAILFDDVPFMGFKAVDSKGQTLGVLIGAAAVIIGWLFTARSQSIDSTKANTMKILMDSRFSDEYSRNLSITTKLYTEERNTQGDACCLSLEKFSTLDADQSNSVNYMLNYFEFIAVGIRCGDLDEQFIRQSLRTIILVNFKFYKLVIEEKQKKAPSALENLVSLVNRWS